MKINTSFPMVHMKNPHSIEIFVPGRVCLFGEHSDWAGAFRRTNPDIQPGQVIIAGTNQGIHAVVAPRKGVFHVKSTLPGGLVEEISLPMEPEALAAAAKEGSFFSYAAGVAHVMKIFYQVDGLDIDNDWTTLPVKKGLSSSAAFCVLVARAFNLAYGLKLTVRAEMEAAYQGEILTPSRCGRMDQGCAYGQGPVLMTFDGDQLATRKLAVSRPVYLLIADLKAKKDTVRILSDLTAAYPMPRTEADRLAHDYLGRINQTLVLRAVHLLEEGDAEGLGRLMTEAQGEFDRCLGPLCPEELTAPRLHTILADETVKRYAWGGKGIGSQGDGCVQLIAKSPEEREKLRVYLEGTLKLDCFNLDILPPATVRKAIIPAAGIGSRMFPGSRAVKKELFPVVTPEGECKPVIQLIVEEALSAGVEEIAIVVGPGEASQIREFFSPVPAAIRSRLSEKAQAQCRHLEELGKRVTFIEQPEPLGFGHAVYCAREWVGDEPVLLLLGDHIYRSATETSCATQLLEAYRRLGGRCVLSVCQVPRDMVHCYGTLTGTWSDRAKTLLDVTEFAEKPSLDYARGHLAVEGLPSDVFLCVFGQYVLTPDLFQVLGRQIDANVRQKNEFQLTTALDELRASQGLCALAVAGTHFDMGQPAEYLDSLMQYAQKRR